MTDLLMKAADLIAPLHDEEADKALPALTRQAERFLRAGGTLTLQDWTLLDPISRVAFEAAGCRVRSELAARTGLAAQSLGGALEVLADVDGGEARAKVACEMAAAKALQRIKKENRS